MNIIPGVYIDTEHSIRDNIPVINMWKSMKVSDLSSKFYLDLDVVGINEPERHRSPFLEYLESLQEK